MLKGLPLLETHAHLNGSIPHHAIDELVRLKSSLPGNSDLVAFSLPSAQDVASSFSVSDFFPLFGSFVYRLTNDASSVTYATLSVLHYFANAGCIYLELRTTPRAVHHTGLTLAGYVDAVREGFRTYHQSSKGGEMLSKLILSVDRRHSLEVATKVVELALSNRDLVVGLDICGDPEKGDTREFVELFKRAKLEGLKVTVHLGELPSQLGTQASDLSLLPDRLGHATHLSPTTVNHILATRLPIEICLTSNLICRTVPTLTAHHLSWAVSNNIPVLICTDDALIFHTTPSKEYELALSVCEPPTLQELGRVVLSGIEALFCSEEEKGWVRGKIEAWLLEIDIAV